MEQKKTINQTQIVAKSLEYRKISDMTLQKI